MKIKQENFVWYKVKPDPPPWQQATELPSSAEYALDRLRFESQDGDRLAYVALRRCGKDVPALRRLAELDRRFLPANQNSRRVVAALRAEAMAEVQKLVSPEKNAVEGQSSGC